MNDDLIELNELNKNSKGGTELLLQRLYNGSVPRELLQKVQVIASRVRDLSPDKPRILWLHDLPEDPESARMSDPNFRRKFSRLVFVSNWQLQRYAALRGVLYSESIVIQNAIEPIVVDRNLEETPDQIRLIYHTTPHRGLNILVPVYEELYKHFGDKIHLDVYSSFKIYGWEERDAQYKEIFERCKNHPGITYHGSVSNEEIRTALANSHIFAYPCIWQETSCLALIEAMSAGLSCVHPNYAALPETSMGLTWQYHFNEDLNAHAMVFMTVLKQVIEAHINQPENVGKMLRWQKAQVDRTHDWKRAAQKWELLLRDVTSEQVK